MKKTSLFIVATIAFGLAGYAIYLFFREIIQLYSAADAELKLGVVTAFGSALAFIINNAIQSSRERRSRLFEAKREAYGSFFAAFTSFFHKIGIGEDIAADEMVTAIQKLSTDVMTWGSAETINAFNQYQRANANSTNDNNELFSRTEKFLRALRKDLGHGDSSLQKLALTKVLLRGMNTTSSIKGGALWRHATTVSACFLMCRAVAPGTGPG